MRKFAILDGSQRKAQPCAYLNWDDKDDALSIDITNWAKETDVPMLLAPFVRKGLRSLDDAWARRWVEERVVPSGRQNLGQVLRANGLEYYEPIALLIAGEGRCSQDDFYIREIVGEQAAGGDGEGLDAAGEDCASGENGEADTTGASELNSEGGNVSSNVGEAIREARKSAGKSQLELAQACGIAQSALSNLERGRSNPTLGLLNDVAAALGKNLVVRLE